MVNTEKILNDTSQNHQIDILLCEFGVRLSRKLVIQSSWIFISQVPGPWIGTSNMNNPTVTSHIPHFWRGIWAKCRGIFGAQVGIEDVFLHYIKAFLDGILLIFHAWETSKSTIHNPDPPPASLTMISLLIPDGQIFIATVLFQQTKMKGDVADNLVSRCHHSWCPAD